MSNKDLMKSGGTTEVAADDIERRLAQMREQAVLNEERVIRGGCAATGGTYLVRFRRKAPGARFSVAAIEKVTASQAESRPVGGLFKRTAPEPESFSWKEFDTRAWECPYCGAEGSITHCDKCHRQVCSAGFRVLPNGRELFECHVSCGARFYTANADNVTAGSGKGGAKESAAPKLAAPALRLSGPRR